MSHLHYQNSTELTKSTNTYQAGKEEIRVMNRHQVMKAAAAAAAVPHIAPLIRRAISMMR
jgi:hypothetical protein